MSLMHKAEPPWSLQGIEEAELARDRELLRALDASHGESTPDTEDGSAPLHQTPAAEEQRLWVSQYAPRSYMQLLTAERVNVGVLSWLRSWDATVFGTAPPPKAGQAALPDLRDDKRPEVKGILLAGNPGATSHHV